MYRLAQELFPYCRSITGDGVRRTLATLQEQIPLTVLEVPTGTVAYDWTIPKEWNIRDAYVKNSHGQKVIDFQRCNLHVVSYSIPYRGTLSLEELKKHIHTLPDHPGSIPYRTTYYKENWGFCMAHREFLQLEEGLYEICVDSTFKDGHLTYGELHVPGQVSDEVLVSCHICHPSLANDNLSGICVAVQLAKRISQISHRLSYRFVFTPGTIGAIAWLARNEAITHRIRHGVVLTCIGDSGALSYKRSRQGNAMIDRAFVEVVRHSRPEGKVLDFSPYGYDERQYCSPGFDLPVGCLMRSVHGTFPEYHTSADNLAFISSTSLADSYAACLRAFDILENDHVYLNQNPKCEPQLGKRGLYRSTGGASIAEDSSAMLWVLNLSDGTYSLLDIAERSGLPFETLRRAASALNEVDLLRAAGQAHSAVECGF